MSNDQIANFFNFDDMTQGIARELAEGLTARIFPGDQAMVSIARLEPDAEGTLHHHPEEQWGFLIEGSAVRTQGDANVAVSKGDFWRTPGDVPHTIKAGPEGAIVLDVFAPPREAYKKAGSGFGES